MPSRGEFKPAAYRRVLYALLGANAVALLLFVFRASETRPGYYWFIVWNLFLAWLPLLFAVWLASRLRTTRWLTWQNIVLSSLWIGFLPNSFYLASDLIHLRQTDTANLLYDVVMFCSFIFCGFAVGFMSVYIIHRELLRRFAARTAYLTITLVFLACGYAIYLGRSLRWNSWDLLINPAGLLFDLSDQFVNPAARSYLFVTTVTFFLLLASAYAVIWELAGALENKRK